MRARERVRVLFATLSLRCSSEGTHSLLSALVEGEEGNDTGNKNTRSRLWIFTFHSLSCDDCRSRRCPFVRPSII